MSLENATTMKLSLSDYGESRWGWIRLGNDALFLKRSGGVPESKNNRCYASSHRHGGVGGVGMLRSVIETNREILTDVEINEAIKTTRTTSPCDKGVVVCEEVGVAHSSVDASVMECRAKEPYLVDVNREVSGLALTVFVRSGLAFANSTERRCDGW